ncbi:Cytochrome P450, family 4, subfamily V, polypeptide 2 [Operophtera brumata]|uniref:Cytochrome P450, family 4, subfamily V, polypeptide 2 n=1 Tax=Operophtera brumata TaxID=104452 RepID=A0A0L7L3E4_OPEBR|nr:Cytochrome P450, family 4, subfamily V, polypeptide 2 [Operophtera brumata]
MERDIAKLVYLEAVLKETFRLYPVAPLVERHTDKDLKLKKYTIPAGSDFMVYYYAVNRHPMWGPDAEQFRPERWLDGTAPTNPNLFASFGIGRRSCIDFQPFVDKVLKIAQEKEGFTDEKIKHQLNTIVTAGYDTTANTPTWKKNRKLLHPMFGLQHVRRYLPVFNLQARRLVERFTEHENKGAFNPELHVHVVSLESICHFQPFVDKVIKIAQDNERFTDENIRDELKTIVLAGYDTTANNRDVDKDDIPKLVYLDAFLKEALRLYPVAPVVARHTDVDVKLKKHTIPAGSDFFVVTYAINRHPMWGPDAEQFRPERWLDGTAPTNPNLFATFGLGKRSCIGRTYNMLSMKTTISHAVRRFRITADISKLVLKQDMLLKPASGQHIILEPRID